MIRRDVLHGDNRRRERHRGREPGHRGVIRRQSVHADPETHHPEPGRRHAQRSRRRSQVHEFGLEPGGARRLKGFGEGGDLCGIRVGAGVGKVAPHAANDEPAGALVRGCGLDEFEPLRGIRSVTAQTGVDLQLHERPTGCRGHPLELLRVAHADVDAALDRGREVDVGFVEPGEDRRGDTRRAQLERLGEVGRAQPGRAGLDHRASHRHRTVSVGVGLHDHHGGSGRSRRGQHGEIRPDRVEVDEGFAGHDSATT